MIDSISNDYIENATIYINDTFVGVSNSYGYLKAEFYKGVLKVNHNSYQNKDVSLINLPKGILDIPLNPNITNFKGITVNGHTNFTKSDGKIIVPTAYLKKLPYIMGELDPLKALQTFPGISSSYEANSGLYVRGGNIDQTSIYLDDAPIYNIGHFYGFFSPFDAESLKNFTFYNSGLYSGYGSRGSSVLDVRLREGNMNKHHGLFSLGFLTSKLLLEGPIIKNKISFIGSLRFAYPGTFINLKFNNNFIDGNFKLKYLINTRNTIYASSFISNDVFSLENINSFTVGNSFINKYSWGNKTATFRWDNITKQGISIHYTGSLSKFSSKASFTEDIEPDFGNELQNYSLKIEFEDFTGVLKNTKLGYSTNYYVSKPAVLYYHRGDTPTFTENILPVSHALETCIFGENIFNLKNSGIDITSNLRLGIYRNLDDLYQDIIFEPRFKIRKKFKKLILFGAFDKTSQYQTYVGNKQIAIPSDYWIQASNQFNAQKIFAYTLGISKEVKKYLISVDFFYKDYKNALDIRDGGILFRNKSVLKDILTVKSLSYGSEFLMEKHFGKIQGHLAYTLSRSIRKSPLINDNQWFASNFDRTHMFNLAMNYKPNIKWTWGLLGILQSGTPVTANYAFNFLYSLRNEYRLPLYYRIDLTVIKKFKIRNRIDAEWNVSVFNATFAKNRTSQYPALGSFGSLPTIPSFGIKIIY